MILSATEYQMLKSPNVRSYVEDLVNLDKAWSALVLKNFIVGLDVTPSKFAFLNENELEDTTTLIELYMELIQEAAEKSKAKEAELITYSPQEVATYIGVSKPTIHSWIQSGRIKGVEQKPDRSWTRIPENAQVRGKGGIWISVAELKKNWQEENQEPLVSEEEYLKKSIEAMQHKYGGKTFVEVFGESKYAELTEADTDASVWLSYEERLKVVKSRNPQDVGYKS